MTTTRTNARFSHLGWLALIAGAAACYGAPTDSQSTSANNPSGTTTGAAPTGGGPSGAGGGLPSTGNGPHGIGGGPHGMGGGMPAATTGSSTATTTVSSGAGGGGQTCQTGDGVNDACSCNDDAKKYCSGLYSNDWKTWATSKGYTTSSWKYSLLDCLKKNPVSSACTASLKRREDLNAALNTACQADRSKYCKGVEPTPGSEPEVDCLWKYESQLSTACYTALMNHDCAKEISQATHCKK